MRSSYMQEDVEILLKDITGMVQPESSEERERKIQSGRHYCEMLPIEYSPTAEYRKAYEQALSCYSEVTAGAVGILADRIMKMRGKTVVLVSLARAGIPAGILVKRFIRQKYGINVPHYAISIIRDHGIDKNALSYILKRHKAENLLFVDGWIGKGAILRQLEEAVKEFEGVSPQLAVIADPANVTSLCGTHEDILIPSSCLNCTVSGLISRTFLRDDIIGPEDFHGALYYGELEQEDLSYQFIDAIQKHFRMDSQKEGEAAVGKGIDEVLKIAEVFGVEDINLIKPGIGEATRVLLRRVPWKILISEGHGTDRELAHLLRLAEEREVPVEYYPLENYKVCGIIRKMADI